MEILLVCLFIILLLAFVTKFPLGYAQAKTGKYDNSLPRQQQSSLSGFGARALAGHQNAFEALIFFSTAVFAVIISNSINHIAELSAIIFVIARLFYQLFYLIDKAKLRTLSWLIGFAATIVIYCQVFKHFYF